MSAVQVFSREAEHAEADVRLIGVSAAAELADCHPETVREAARSGLLHGSQRKRINPKTGRAQTKGGTWKFHPSCVIRWAEGEDCDHHSIELRAPVALAGFRGRSR